MVEKVNILLVDDRPENLVALRASLEALGENLVEAGSGREALQRLLEDDFAVILLDVQMPEMDGFQTATLIRGRERSRSVPIIFLTAYSKEEVEIFRGYESGAVDYLFKPFVPEILRSKVAVFVDLHRTQRALERQLEETARVNRELAAANEELEAFSYTVSHDLRAPLRHIHGFVEMLERHAAGVLDERGRRCLQTIGESALKMNRLIDDLLTFSRSGRTGMNKIRLSLEELVGEVVGELAPEAGVRKVAFQVGALPEVEADRALLRLALVNLVGNALKYTCPREEARIEVGAQEGNGETLLFVRDNGVGFDSQNAARIFEPFRRLHTGAEFEGTGVGLATVRRIIERHGGRIWAEGAPGAGACFSFTLPT